MRWKPLRGEKFMTLDGEEVTIVEVQGGGKSEYVSVILPSGKMGSLTKAQLNLPTIETKDYQKMGR